MSRLVHEGVDVVGNADSVHEDERLAAEAQLRAIAPRRLPLPALEVQQTLLGHQGELFAELRVDAAEDGGRAIDERRDVLERAQGLDPLELDTEVPRPNAVEAEPLAAILELSRYRGHDRALDGLVKARAVRRRIIEPMLRLERVLLIVREPGVARNLRTRHEHLVEQRRQLIVVREVGLVADPPGALAHLPVALLEVRLQLRDGLRLPIPLHRQSADDLLVLRAQLLELREQGNVLLAEDLGIRPEAGDGGFEAGASVPELDQSSREADALLVGLRKDLGGEPEMRLLLVGV